MTQQIQDYRQIREQIRNGDVILFSGYGPLHLGVRFGEWARRGFRGGFPEFSHVGCAYWVDGSLFIIEQNVGQRLRGGCVLTRFSKALYRFRGTLHWCRSGIDPKKAKWLAGCIDTVDYGFSELVAWPSRASLRFCSAVVHAFLTYVYDETAVHIPKTIPMPDDVLTTLPVEYVCQIRMD